MEGAKYCAACGTALIVVEPDANAVDRPDVDRLSAEAGGAATDATTPQDVAPTPSITGEGRDEATTGRPSPGEWQARLALMSTAHRWRLMAAAAAAMFGLLLALSVVVYLLRLPSSGPSSAPSELSWIALALGVGGLAAGVALFVPLSRLNAQASLKSDHTTGEPAVLPLMAAMLAGALLAVGSYVGLGLGSTGQASTYVAAPSKASSPGQPSSTPTSPSTAAPPASVAPGSSSPTPSGADTFGTQVATNAPCPAGKSRSPAGSPRVTDARAAEHSTSMHLKPGSQLYVYGYATGGAQASGNFAIGNYTSISDAAKNVVDALAITTSPSNAYATRTSANALVGAALDNFSSCTVSYAVESEPGAALASTSFKVAKKGSLAVFVALAGGGQAITLTGPPNIATDAVVPASGKIAVVIAQATLGSGNYKVTESTSPRIPGENSANNPDVGDLLAVLVLSPAP